MQYYANNPSSTLSADIGDADTSLTLVSATGYPSGGDFIIKIDSELILVTGVTSDTFTVVRGQEGTSALLHYAGTYVYMPLTDLSLRRLVGIEHNGGQVASLRNTNYVDGTNITWTTNDNEEYERIDLQAAVTALRTGSGAPSDSLGFYGDTYIDTTNGNLYLKTGDTYSLVAALGGGGGSLTIAHNGTTVAAEATLNFIDGTGLTYTIADDSGDGRVNVTPTASGGGGGGGSSLDLVSYSQAGGL